MAYGHDDTLRYSIFDPTGNITALVESDVEVGMQPSVAADLMRRHPEVEQVGFVRRVRGGDVQGALRMAGGEFCGNATMSAAAWLALNETDSSECSGNGQLALRLGVSGASQPVEVRLRKAAQDTFEGFVHMPPALGIDEVKLSFADESESLPVVRMEGISHVVIESCSAFFALRDEPERAERAIRAWCSELGADGLGLMFVEGETGVNGSEKETDPSRLTPLVFVPGANTVFWESSCASGSAAVGMHAAARLGAPIELSLHEPGGCLHVKSDPACGETWLGGMVRLEKRIVL